MIRKATYKDIDSILEITRACADFMINNAVFQWNENYPSRKAFENDVSRDELFLLEKESKILGCIVISTFMDEEYVPITWLTPNNNNIYIHRLAVHPNSQGKGYAQKLMDFAETFAVQNHFTSVRLDTFSQNTRNQKFYELRNYRKTGKIYFPKQSKFPFYCYELIL
ncbi:GNAT family N-acetyltransferase [Xanthomarina sp. F2636L]|uniref:GNAT family N-acetyltransferase n=1 Tax=Xanthomarina sp. F2636L TaxID=2996018 RepID=UPI00225E6B4B|nr:GNAT family N-acetyltransferase [Xanthomarina sp. F2636L]MCX7551210.1 GNAT family N-acetyltransferase [Xanthomarina sp. F2636L]